MQIFLFGALAISLVAVVFALQNIGPVTVTFLNMQFEGSLALVLFVAFVAGALVSFLASVPTLVKNHWAVRDLRRQVAALDDELARKRDALPRPAAGPPVPMVAPRPVGTDRPPPREGGAPIEPKP